MFIMVIKFIMFIICIMFVMFIMFIKLTMFKCHPLSSYYILFHPLSSSFILFYPFSSYFILFHPLSSVYYSSLVADMFFLVCSLDMSQSVIWWPEDHGFAFQTKAMVKTGIQKTLNLSICTESTDIIF